MLYILYEFYKYGGKRVYSQELFFCGRQDVSVVLQGFETHKLY